MSSTESTFYVTGGTLRQDAACYVERQADKDLLDGLLKGEFCYVLTSRQMGKSSLMVRTAGKLREQGVRVAVLDLTAVGQPEAKETPGRGFRSARRSEPGSKRNRKWLGPVGARHQIPRARASARP